MADSTKLERYFTHDSLPPLFSKDFDANNHTWTALSGIDFDKIGRVLVCHLLIEHHLDKLIELNTPSSFDWNNTKLTFTQKVKLLKKDYAFQQHDFVTGMEIINKIRNKYSHVLEVSISAEDIKRLKAIIMDYRTQHQLKEPEPIVELSDEATIESFTSIFCAYFAGYCTALAVHKKVKKPIPPTI